MKKYYEVRLSYSDDTQNVTIDENDLPTVLWAFANNTKAILNTSAFRGQDIISILPNHVLSMGWHKGYQPKSDEWGDIYKKLGKSLENYQSQIKNLIPQSNSLQELREKVTNSQKLLN